MSERRGRLEILEAKVAALAAELVELRSESNSLVGWELGDDGRPQSIVATGAEGRLAEIGLRTTEIRKQLAALRKAIEMVRAMLPIDWSIEDVQAQSRQGYEYGIRLRGNFASEFKALCLKRQIPFTPEQAITSSEYETLKAKYAEQIEKTEKDSRDCEDLANRALGIIKGL